MLSTDLPTVDIPTSNSTSVVEVASHTLTQEPTTEGSPLADHVKQDSSLGPSVIDNVSLSFANMKTQMSEVPPEGSTQEPLTSGTFQQSNTPIILLQKMIYILD